MKKSFAFLSTAAAIIGAGLMGATVAPNIIQANADAQQLVAEQSNAAGGSSEPQQQSGSVNDIKSFGYAMAYPRDSSPEFRYFYGSSHHKWCNAGGSRGFNKIKHGRSKRRKHRRK